MNFFRRKIEQVTGDASQCVGEIADAWRQFSTQDGDIQTAIKHAIWDERVHRFNLNQGGVQ